jgi:hypothetical protein
MIKSCVAVALATALSAACVATAFAEDFPAAPMNPGPLRVTGLGPAGDLANVALLPVNAIAVPILAPGPVAAPEPMVVHHRHHRWHHRM